MEQKLLDEDGRILASEKLRGTFEKYTGRHIYFYEELEADLELLFLTALVGNDQLHVQRNDSAGGGR